MKKEDFYFDLPPELIAQKPLANRHDSRLLVHDKDNKQRQERAFVDLVDYLNPGDLLIFNNTKVIPARLYGKKETGGKIEILIERLIDDNSCLCHIKASKSPAIDSVLILEGGYELTVTSRTEKGLFTCQLLKNNHSKNHTLLSIAESIGHIPLPPYIEREDEAFDHERYQTIYAKHKGSVAAPTAGLHFDDMLFEKIQAKGINVDYLTLHVGAGTFQPVRVSNLTDHIMHKELVQVSQELCDKINQTKRRGGKIIAVGTTAVRSLESAASSGEIKAFCGDTDIFIYPGYQFKVVDAMITNFHLPESSLIMLVAAFIGHGQTMALYQHAIDSQYRFFSYGDACLLI